MRTFIRVAAVATLLLPLQPGSSSRRCHSSLEKCRPGNSGTGFRLLIVGKRDVVANPRC